MIYLFTGVPGAGKTLQVVSMLAKSKDFKNRLLFVDGITDLKIPYEQIPEGESIQTWPKWAPPGAVIVVDECQRIFRPRPSGSKVPDYVAELETHRHRGLDFLLITQHPRLIDVHLRSLIEHHTHFSKTNLGIRRKLEWTTGGAKDPESRANIRDALVSVYKLDKSAYGLYKSSEQHTKIKTKKSKLLLLLPLSLCLIGYGLWSFYGLFNGDKDTQQAVKQPEAPVAVAAPPSTASVHPGQYPPVPVESKQQTKPHLAEDDYKPAIDGQPWTAPIYNAHNKSIKNMPFPAVCVKTESKCTCYTDQATPIKGIKKSQCIDYAENGIYNPYKDRQSVETPAQTVVSPAVEPQQVLVMGGASKSNLMYDGYNEARVNMQ